MASKDEAYCDLLKRKAPAFEAGCRMRVRAALSGGGSPTASGLATSQAWSGVCSDKPDSPLRLVLGADGRLTGSGYVTVTGDPAVNGARLTVTESSVGTDQWTGTMKVELVGADGKIQYDPIQGLGGAEAVTWSANRDGEGLSGTVDTYGGFVLSPAS